MFTLDSSVSHLQCGPEGWRLRPPLRNKAMGAWSRGAAEATCKRSGLWSDLSPSIFSRQEPSPLTTPRCIQRVSQRRTASVERRLALFPGMSSWQTSGVEFEERRGNQCTESWKQLLVTRNMMGERAWSHHIPVNLFPRMFKNLRV